MKTYKPHGHKRRHLFKVGDLVEHCFSERIGVILKEVHDPVCATTINKVFDVAWIDGTTGHNIWNYDLEKVNESR